VLQGSVGISTMALSRTSDFLSGQHFGFRGQSPWLEFIGSVRPSISLLGPARIHVGGMCEELMAKSDELLCRVHFEPLFQCLKDAVLNQIGALSLRGRNTG
jgi:hypothetical protein